MPKIIMLGTPGYYFARMILTRTGLCSIVVQLSHEISKATWTTCKESLSERAKVLETIQYRERSDLVATSTLVRPEQLGRKFVSLQIT